MIQVLIAYDNNDGDLGDYLGYCYQDIEFFINANNDANLISLDGLSCNEKRIKHSVTLFNNNPFIFIGYSHGDKEYLATTNEIFVSFSNSMLFTGSLFYSCACHSGDKLGPELLRQGCNAFIGYNDTLYVLEDYTDLFIECMNSGIKFFLFGGISIKESYTHMKNTYQLKIDQLILGTADDFIAASLLTSNLKSLILLGNESLTIKDYIIRSE